MHRSVQIPPRPHDRVCSAVPSGGDVFRWLLATVSPENQNSSSSQMQFSSSPTKSNAARFITFFIAPFSRQPSLSKQCFQPSSSSLYTVPEVFISVHGWHDGKPHKRAQSDLRRGIMTIRETLFIRLGCKLLTGARIGTGVAFTAHQLHTHTLFQSYVQLNQLISSQTVFRGWGQRAHADARNS